MRATIGRWFQYIKRRLAIYEKVLGDPETPRLARWCIIAAIAYFASPIDLIPDFVPVLGQLDDLIVVALLLLIAQLLTPRRVFARHRENEAVGTD